MNLKTWPFSLGFVILCSGSVLKIKFVRLGAKMGNLIDCSSTTRPEVVSKARTDSTDRLTLTEVATTSRFDQSTFNKAFNMGNSIDCYRTPTTRPLVSSMRTYSSTDRLTQTEVSRTSRINQSTFNKAFNMGNSIDCYRTPTTRPPVSSMRTYSNTDRLTQTEVSRTSRINQSTFNKAFNEHFQQILQQQLQQLKIEQEQQRTVLIETEKLEAKKRQQQEHLKFAVNTQKITKNLQLINDLRTAFDLNTLETFPDKPYEEKELEYLKYEEVANIFESTNKPYFTISKITSVNNIFNELHFKLSKEIYRQRHEDKINDILAFHGTKLGFLKGICTYNFDRSKVCTHKFGHGISFAKDAYYATHYHQDNKFRREKVMIIVKILLDNLQVGTKFMVIPQEPFYTSTNPNKSVIVKYDDASFYPLYIVYYEGLHPQRNYHKRFLV